MLTSAELHEGLSQLEGHYELWDSFLEQPGRRTELQLEQPAEPQSAHRHSQLFQWWVSSATFWSGRNSLVSRGSGVLELFLSFSWRPSLPQWWIGRRHLSLYTLGKAREVPGSALYALPCAAAMCKDVFYNHRCLESTFEGMLCESIHLFSCFLAKSSSALWVIAVFSKPPCSAEDLPKLNA